jgi:hypothetical protein
MLTSRIVPRTTLDIESVILEELRARAKAEGKTIGRLATDLLREALENPDRSTRPEFRWTTHRMGAPLIDLEDKAAVEQVLAAVPQPA